MNVIYFMWAQDVINFTSRTRPRGPYEGAGSRVLGGSFMTTYIAYVDEFGHDGPFISRHHELHNDSPVFGLAGFVLPVNNVRRFSTYFFELKKNIFKAKIEKSGRPAAKWEMKGIDHFRPSKIMQPEVRANFTAPLNTLIHTLDGHVFYAGSEKNHLKKQVTPTNLYTHALKETIKLLDNFCTQKNAKLLLCADHHNNKKAMIEACVIEMFGFSNRANLLEPMFHADSHLYQTVQFADWIAAIVGKCQAFSTRPAEYKNYQPFHHYFDDRLTHAAIGADIKPV